MTEQELIEILSHHEHCSWSRWMAYLFTKCHVLPDGSALIPSEFVARWQRQATTEYADLSKREKQSDRHEVAHILPIIREYSQQ